MKSAHGLYWHILQALQVLKTPTRGGHWSLTLELEFHSPSLDRLEYSPAHVLSVGRATPPTPTTASQCLAYIAAVLAKINSLSHPLTRKQQPMFSSHSTSHAIPAVVSRKQPSIEQSFIEQPSIEQPSIKNSRLSNSRLSNSPIPASIHHE